MGMASPRLSFLNHAKGPPPLQAPFFVLIIATRCSCKTLIQVVCTCKKHRRVPSLVVTAEASVVQTLQRQRCLRKISPKTKRCETLPLRETEREKEREREETTIKERGVAGMQMWAKYTTTDIFSLSLFHDHLF